MLLLVSAFFGVVGRASGWKDCLISPQDEWKEATEPIPAMRMRAEYDRGYTCTTSYNGSLAAANYYFDSACSLKRFHPAEAIEVRFALPDVLVEVKAGEINVDPAWWSFPAEDDTNTDPTDHQCLKGRRMIFLGDSLTNQQGDSLVGMLDWHPEWMPKGGYRNNKKDVDENGNPYYTLVDCYRPPTGSIGSVERCYDLHDTDFPPDIRADAELGEDAKPYLELHIPADQADQADQSTFKPADHNRMRALRGHEKEAAETDLEEEDNSISVHVRMSSRPKGERWISRAVLDYNETRASDVFVVNFGAHYPATPEGDEEFKQAVFPLLDEMAVVGETATAVWREMSPVHFPSENGSYVNFLAEDLENANTVCCTGTPPKVLDRNVWVENYLRENGLSDRVKILRIYDMSMPRGAAHHTCHLAPPSTMDQTGTESDYCHSNYGPDCTHWSETGVVEEWNAILLNHICPVNE